MARGFVGGREGWNLELRMYVGAADPQDTIEIDGDPPVRMTIDALLARGYRFVTVDELLDVSAYET